MPVPLPSLKWLVFNIFKKSILVSTITKRTINILISFVYDNVQLFAATWIIVLASDLHQGERFFENIGENFYYFFLFLFFGPYVSLFVSLAVQFTVINALVNALVQQFTSIRQ